MKQNANLMKITSNLEGKTKFNSEIYFFKFIPYNMLYPNPVTPKLYLMLISDFCNAKYEKS